MPIRARICKAVWYSNICSNRIADSALPERPHCGEDCGSFFNWTVDEFAIARQRRIA